MGKTYIFSNPAGQLALTRRWPSQPIVSAQNGPVSFEPVINEASIA